MVAMVRMVSTGIDTGENVSFGGFGYLAGGSSAESPADAYEMMSIALYVDDHVGAR